jgi:hypothetical protein
MWDVLHVRLLYIFYISILLESELVGFWINSLNPASAPGFQKSNIKIRRLSTVNSDYQQTPMLGGGRFQQTYVQEWRI